MSDDVTMRSDEIAVYNSGCVCEQSMLERADGSCSYKQGKTEVLTAVYGPSEVRMNKELIDKATIECNFRLKSGLSGCAEKVTERLIRNSCNAIILSTYHPRSAISIIVQVIHDAGQLLSCALNSACMALLNAGIPLKYMAGAVSCSLLKDGNISLDSVPDEEQKPMASFTFVFESSRKDVITSWSQGKYTVEQYFRCLAASRQAVQSVFDFQRTSVERSLSMEKKD